MKTKKCPRCKETKPRTLEYFHKSKTRKDGMNGVCKDCIKEWNRKQRERYKNDPEYRKKRLEYDRKYKESGKRYLSNNKPKNRERAREYSKKYNKENREKLNAFSREYRKKKPEIVKKLGKRANSKAVTNLPDHYVRNRIQQQIKRGQIKISPEDITPEMIETKRLLIFINRELKIQKNGKQPN